MNLQSKIGPQLAVAGATLLTALAILAPPAPGGGVSSDCRLPAWAYVWTGHWGGGDCR